MNRTTSALTDTQRLYNLIREAADEAAAAATTHRLADEATPHRRHREDAQFQTGRQAGLVAALHMLTEIDPDADPGEHVPGRVYSGGAE